MITARMPLWMCEFGILPNTLTNRPQVRQYTLIFTVLYSISQLTVISLSLRHFSVSFLVSHALYFGCFWLAQDLVSISFLVRFVSSSVVYWLFNLWADEARRMRWRLDRVFQWEMKRLNDILRDLLPVHLYNPHNIIANNSIPLPSCDTRPGIFGATMYDQPSLQLRDLHDKCERDALVLQLDLCSFTEISQTMSALELAQMLHLMFSDFDQ